MMRYLMRYGRRRAVVLILCGMLAVCGSLPGGCISCKAKETAAGRKQDEAVNAKQAKDTGIEQKKIAAEDEEQEIIEFVTAYYKAQSPEGIDTLADYVDDPQSEDFQRDLLRQRVTFREGGVQGWENLKVIVLPMSDGKHWVVSVSGELIVEEFDVGIPGLKVELVGRNEEGELEIAMYDEEEFSDAFLKEVRELSLSDEIMEHNNETAAAYNDLISERSDIMAWTFETRDAVDKEMGKELAREDALSEKADSGENGEEDKPDARNGSYTVQKGDCLWDIAEKQLGDGMCWSGLYEQNKDVIGENPDLLYVGITLQLD